jgi:hypothetical protein
MRVNDEVEFAGQQAEKSNYARGEYPLIIVDR